MFVVVDLDGTLCNAEHRLHHIQGEQKDWRAFYEACDADLPIGQVREVVVALHRKGHEIAYWTGRADEGDVRAKTMQWLYDKAMPCETTYDPKMPGTEDLYAPLRMRAAGDFRPDYLIKQEWLAQRRAAGMNVDLALEDRDQVVRMWRESGVMCLQVAPGDF